MTYCGPGQLTVEQLASLPRSCGYWSLLSGCAGYTYGCRRIWNWNLTVLPGEAVPDDQLAKLWDWRVGMNRPSSTDMQHLAALFQELTW